MANGEITQTEVIPDVTNWKLSEVNFRVGERNLCKVDYKKKSAGDVDTGLKKVFLFENVADDPETPEDESSTEFTQLITKINNESNIKTSIDEACVYKLNNP